MKTLRHLYYVPLESYASRYTYQLEDWSVSQFKELGADVIVVPGLVGLQEIRTGQVLDASARPIHCLKQIEMLIREISNGNTSDEDFILFEDMMHPGIEGLFYVLSQLKYNKQEHRIPKIGMRCLAQTIDPDDFVHYTGMSKWMRHYEHMVNSFVDCLFAASTEMIGYMRAAGWDAPVFVTGLPFNKKAVQDFHGLSPTKFYDRPMKVVFASRLASEKNLDFLGAVAFALSAALPDSELCILSGVELCGSPSALLNKAIETDKIQVYDKCSKKEYYDQLSNARVLFNCSFQDWISNTASEADTLGCNLVFPAYRSFPEAFDNDCSQMYIPWSVADATTKIEDALEHPYSQGKFSDNQDKTNSKTLLFIDALVAEEVSKWYFLDSFSPLNTFRDKKSIQELRQQLDELGVDYDK